MEQRPRLPDAEPAPAATPDEVAAAAGALITEWKATRPAMQEVLGMQRKLYRQRWWQFGATAGLIIVAAVTTVVFGIALLNTKDLARHNAATNLHLAAVVACQNAYDQRLAQVLQARAVAANRQTAALETLIGETLNVTSPVVFRADVAAWKRAVRAAERIPVPPLPPAACS